MKRDHLSTYLNDHLAGSAVALEILENLKEAFAGTQMENKFEQLMIEISSDKLELEKLMNHLEIKVSVTRKAWGWISEKVTDLKLLFDDPAGGDLRLMESLEVLALGIEGKKSLWRALAEVSDGVDELKSVDYSRMLQRAEYQRERVEEERVKAAKKAFIAANKVL